MSKPLNMAFNIAIATITNRLFPTGFDVGPDAPDTLDKLKVYVAETGRMLVWDGASDKTIFADAETNYRFRAWHDWCHLMFDLPFTLEGELEAAEHQKGHIRTVYGNTKQAEEFCNLIDAEVVGQAEHFAKYGAFPKDQRGFVVDYLNGYENRW